MVKHHLLEHGCTHMQLTPGRSKQGTRIFNYDEMVAFNLSPSGTTSDIRPTVSYVLNRPRWPLLRGIVSSLSRNGWKTRVLIISTGLARVMQGVRLIVDWVDDLCNHVGFTDVAAQTGWRRHFDENKPRCLRGKRAETGLHYLKFNYLHLHLVLSQSDHK
jgi:hypothetical protein